MLCLKHGLRYAPARRPGHLPWKKTAPGRGDGRRGAGEGAPLFLCLLGAADALRMGSASQTGGSREGRPRHPAGEAAARPGAAGGWVAAGLRRVPSRSMSLSLAKLVPPPPSLDGSLRGKGEPAPSTCRGAPASPMHSRRFRYSSTSWLISRVRLQRTELVTSHFVEHFIALHLTLCFMSETAVFSLQYAIKQTMPSP